MAELTIRDYSPPRAAGYQKALLDLESSRRPTGYVRLNSPGLRDSSLLALWQAEFLAGIVGAVPLVEVVGPTGKTELGVLHIGGARGIIEKPERWARPGGRLPNGQPLPAGARDVAIDAYLACSGAAAQANSTVREARGEGSALRPVFDVSTLVGATISDTGELTLIGESWHIPPAVEEVIAPLVVVAIVAVGIAATVGGAWWATRTREVEVDAERVIQLAKVGALTELATKEIAMGQAPSRSILEQLGAASTFERGSSWAVPLSLAIGGAACAGAVGFGLYHGLKGGKRRGR